MGTKHKFKAFTLVEILMLLLVASLITAACVPVVTKKHYRLPSNALHGAYMCYYIDGRLHETKWAGKGLSKKVFDRDTNECVFEPPKKASYFQVSAIGGGGGGGDAGYRGGNPIDDNSGDQFLHAKGLSAEDLSSRDIPYDEFLPVAGTLYAYSKSSGSTAGGYIGLMEERRNYVDCNPPTPKHEEWCAEYVTIKASDYDGSLRRCWWEKVDEDTGSGGDSSTSYNTPSLFHKIAMKFSSFKDRVVFKFGQITGAAETGDTSVYCDVEGVYVQTVCDTPATTKTETLDSTCTEPAKDWCDLYVDKKHMEDYDCSETKTGTRTIQGRWVVCAGSSGSCQKSGPSHEQSSSCKTQGSCEIQETYTYTESKTCQREVTEKVCAEGHSHHEDAYEYPCEKTVTINIPATDCHEEYVKEIVSTDCESVKAGLTGKWELKCEENPNTGEDTEICKEWKYKDWLSHAEADCPEENKVWSYYWVGPESPHKIRQNGAAGAAGATCKSTSISGDIGISYSGFSNAYDITQKGEDVDTQNIGTYFCAVTGAGAAGNGFAPCASGTKEECTGGDITRSESKLTNSSGTVKAIALSAKKGGGGGIRTCSGEVDTAGGTAHAAIGGSCNEGSSGSVCGTKKFGWCLRHNGNYKPGVEEEEGQYVYSFTYDNNFLGYGEPGSAGEFKTIIVRSLTSVDTTIKVGRGGSAAALNLGQNGAQGSATSLGDIIKAAGGNGGDGGLSRPGQVLPKYEYARFEKEELCYRAQHYYYDKNADGTWKYPVQRAQLVAHGGIGYCNEFHTGADYQYHILSGGTKGEYPTPVGIVSSLMNFVFDTSDNSEAIQKFIHYGRGGTGGGVEHLCWAGQRVVDFEHVPMKKYSVYPNTGAAYAAGDTAAISEHRYVPNNCRNKWENIPATPGVDGALLIKW